MKELAFITFVDERGQDVAMPAIEILYLRENPNGSIVSTRSGQAIVSQSTVAQMVTKIDTLWDELIAALGA